MNINRRTIPGMRVRKFHEGGEVHGHPHENMPDLEVKDKSLNSAFLPMFPDETIFTPEIAKESGEFKSILDEAKAVGYWKTAKKVLTRPEPENSMWHNFPSYFTDGKTR
mgnify:CR=1 FL=1